MVRRIFLPPLILSGCVLSACSNVAYEYDRGTELQNPRTFTFASEDMKDGSPVEPETLQEAIQRELQEEHIQQTSGDSADLLVSYRFEPEREAEPGTPGENEVSDPAADEASTAATGEAYGPGTGSTVMPMQLRPEEATPKPAQLTIEVQDAESREMIWRASALMDIKEDDPRSERTELINEVVTRMFDKFPNQ